MSQRKTMGRVMHEYAHGELKSGPCGQQRRGDGKVKGRRQAIAIALEEAGASRYESKERNRRNLARSKAKEATGRAGPLLWRNLSSASYKAMGRVTPADYFDGEDTNDKN